MKNDRVAEIPEVGCEGVAFPTGTAICGEEHPRGFALEMTHTTDTYVPGVERINIDDADAGWQPELAGRNPQSPGDSAVCRAVNAHTRIRIRGKIRLARSGVD